MPKRNQNTSAEDYLAHLKYHSQHGHPSSVYYEPKWKFKIKYNLRNPILPFDLLILGSIVLGAIGYLLYQVFFKHSGTAIFISVIVGLIAFVLYLAVRDVQKSGHSNPGLDEEIKSEESSENINE